MGVKRLLARAWQWYTTEPLAPLGVGVAAGVLGVVIGLALRPVIGG